MTVRILAGVFAALLLPAWPAIAQVGPLDARNNLSDVASASTSLSNLGGVSTSGLATALPSVPSTQPICGTGAASAVS